jgi:Kef-type K+ transport system membrane component KefB
LPYFLHIDWAMSNLLIVGGIIAVGLFSGKLSNKVRLPKVTGYLIAGVVIGPSVANIISYQQIENVSIISDIALGLILFTIGGELDRIRTMRAGWRIVLLALAEGFGAMLLVFVGLSVFGCTLNHALLISAIAIATAPAATLLVLWEYEAKGPLTDALTSVVAFNNGVCIILFHAVFTLTDLSHGAAISDAFLLPVYTIAGSIALGTAVGLLVGWVERYLNTSAEILLVIIAGILCTVGTAQMFGLAPMLACMAVGASCAFISPLHRLVGVELRYMELPFYIAFFVLAGAGLHLNELAYLGIPGLIYIFARFAGKIGGAYAGGRALNFPKPVYNYVGLGLAPQAGVAIGLAYYVSDRYEASGLIITTIIFSSIIVFETVGPPLTKLAVKFAGEIKVEN